MFVVMHTPQASLQFLSEFLCPPPLWIKYIGAYPGEMGMFFHIDIQIFFQDR